MGCWQIWCGWRWGEAEFYIHAVNALEIEERFLSAQADRFTLTRASQNESEKQRRRLVPLETTDIWWLAGAGSVGDGIFGRCEDERDSIGVTDIEEHSFGNFTGHFTRFEIDDEERLLAFDFARVGAFFFSFRREWSACDHRS